MYKVFSFDGAACEGFLDFHPPCLVFASVRPWDLCKSLLSSKWVPHVLLPVRALLLSDPCLCEPGISCLFLTDSPMCFLRFWPVLASIGAPKKQIGGSGLLALCSSLGLPPVVGDYASTCHLSLGLWQGLHRSYCLLCRGAGTLVFCYFDAPPHIGIGCEREILVSVSLRQEPQPLPAFNSPFPQRRVADCHYHS